VQTKGQREEILVGQITIDFLLSGDGSKGSLSVFEFTVPVAARVPIAHSHDAYEETVYGLEGVLTWTVNGVGHDVGAGEVLHIPRGVVHRFENRGTSTRSRWRSSLRVCWGPSTSATCATS
jgi:quercetin dioxygenase-like cupin family protein